MSASSGPPSRSSSVPPVQILTSGTRSTLEPSYSPESCCGVSPGQSYTDGQTSYEAICNQNLLYSDLRTVLLITFTECIQRCTRPEPASRGKTSFGLDVCSPLVCIGRCRRGTASAGAGECRRAASLRQAEPFDRATFTQRRPSFASNFNRTLRACVPAHSTRRQASMCGPQGRLGGATLLFLFSLALFRALFFLSILHTLPLWLAPFFRGTLTDPRDYENGTGRAARSTRL